jgi:hypothetical protein
LTSEAEDANGHLELAAEVALKTAADGVQRALECPVESLEALQDLRLKVGQMLAGEPTGSPARRVKPWLWSAATSGGRPLTTNGAETGYELRVSRYAKPVT